jgi:hypothetical protein
MMKKITALLLVLIFIIVLMAGCGAGAAGGKAKPVKTGMAFVTSLDKSKDAGAEDGIAQADSVIVAVTVGEDGKITGCVIDMMETKGSFNTAGEITTPLDTKFMTKNEQGADYGMKKASGIGKEWNEQAAALAKYVVGKTAEEVKGIAVDATGHATGSDLKASVTISIAGFIDALDKAAKNAQDLGAMSTDQLGVGVETNILYSNLAGAENPANPGNTNGNIIIYATFAAATTDKNGKITSCLADGFQCAVSFDGTGKIVSDLAAVPVTKNETGNDYGLKAFSSISKEWFEQTAAIGQYVKGKTAEEVGGIAVKEDTSPESEDMRATVTLKIGEFKKVIVKAAQ